MEYQENRNTHLKLYGNLINIDITPENEVISSFKIDNIPDVVNICYCDVTDIINFFNSPEGGILVQKIYSNEITVNLLPVDTTYITHKEIKYLVGHESMFKRHNVNFYQIWYIPEIQFNYHLGVIIHEALSFFLKKYRSYKFDFSKKTKHFFTLNNYHTPYREDLYNFYKNLKKENQDKFICSFRFADISLKNESSGGFIQLDDYKKVYGINLFEHYDSSLIEIVSESSNVSVTEKCFKALISGVPFIHGIGYDGFDYHNQIEIFKSIGIDTSYFGIDYKKDSNIFKKIKELLSMDIDEILEIYKKDFEKAELNKLKVFEWIDNIETNIIKKYEK